MTVKFINSVRDLVRDSGPEAAADLADSLDPIKSGRFIPGVDDVQQPGDIDISDNE